MFLYGQFSIFEPEIWKVVSIFYKYETYLFMVWKTSQNNVLTGLLSMSPIICLRKRLGI